MKKHIKCIWLGLLLALSPMVQSSGLVAADRLESEETDVLVAVAPGYPPLALMSGIAGEVKARVVVNHEGIVTSANIIDGHRLLREGCKEAGLKWKFAPAGGNQQGERIEELKFVFVRAPTSTATANLTTVFRHPNTIEITRSIPQTRRHHRR